MEQPFLRVYWRVAVKPTESDDFSMHANTLGTMHMSSLALRREVTYHILIPDPQDVGPGPYPVLLQLHGFSDDGTAWLYKSNLLMYAEYLPLIIVLPSTENCWWADVSPSQQFETFVMSDLWNHVTQTFPVRKDGRWAIGGLSMGGFGALRLGLKYPDRFCSIFAHSSRIPTLDEIAVAEPLFPELVRKNLAWRTDMDCYTLAKKVDPSSMPRLSFDCGVDDELLPDNRRFHEHLNKLKLPHQYLEHPGAHTWDYWDKHVQTALGQHSEVFNITPAK